MSSITLSVNGATRTVDVEPSTPLLYVLRNDLDLHGPKFGCGLGQCGACTVIIRGVATRSCVTPVSAVRGEVTTLEGLAVGGTLHPIQQAWIACRSCGRRRSEQAICATRMVHRLRLHRSRSSMSSRLRLVRTLCSFD